MIDQLFTQQSTLSGTQGDPTTWDFADWRWDGSLYRVTGLRLSGMNLVAVWDAAFLSMLEYLDVSRNPNFGVSDLPSTLKTLNCQGNGWASLPSLPTGLTELNCKSNRLTALDPLPAGLKTLDCSDNLLTSLGSLPASLEKLECRNNRLTTVSGLPASLAYLDCNNNDIQTLDLTGASSLKLLWCLKNNISTLDAGGLTALETLECDYNSLATLNLVGCTGLTELAVSYTDLTALNLSGATGLKTLYADNTRLRELDLSSLSQLEWAVCDTNNDLTGVKWPTASRLEYFYFGRCPNLKLSLSSLSHMNSARSIGLDGTQTSGDLSALKNMSSLYSLSLNNTGVTGAVSSLGYKAELERLYVEGTGVTGTAADRQLFPALKSWQPEDLFQDSRGSGVGGNGDIARASTTGGSSRSDDSSGASYTAPVKTQIPDSAFSWDGDRTLTIDHDGTTALGLTGVQWNGVETTAFTVHQGSVIVRFERDFIGSQSSGAHRVRVEFLNHYGETSVTVGEGTTSAENGPYDDVFNDGIYNPNTGDGSRPLILLALLGCFGGLALAVWSRKKRV